MAIRVCHVTSLHKANDGRIFQRYCKSLTKQYEVFLVAPNTETREENGVHIVGVSLPTINQRLQRLLKLKMLLKPLYEIDAEIYHFHDPELMNLGLKLKQRGKKIVFDSHEDVLNQIQNKGYIPRPFRKIVTSIYGFHERRCLRQYDAIVSVTGFIVDRLKAINPNTYQITNYPIIKERPLIKRSWDRIVCFAGSLSEDWMLSHIVNVLPAVNANMLMAGFYATEEYLDHLKCFNGWKNVEFFGTLPHDDVLGLYNKASIGLAIESYTNPNVGYKVGSLGVTKITDYMASGLPVIVSNSEVWGAIVRKHQCGIVVNDPTNEEEIASAISFILDNPEEAKRMSENALIATKEVFNWGTQESIVFDMYKSLLRE